MKLIKLVALLLLAALFSPAQAIDKCKKLNFVPMPREITCGNDNATLDDPCKLLFHVKLKYGTNEHIEELIAFQMRQTLHCRISNVVISPTLNIDVSNFPYRVEVEIDDPTLKSVFRSEEEQYEMVATMSGTRLRAITYVGFVRAL